MHRQPPLKHRTARFLLLLLVSIAPAALVEITHPAPLAAADTATPTAPASKADDLTAKRAKVADEIAQLTKTKQSSVAAGEAASAVDPADEEIELLGALDLVYVQLQAVSEHHDELGHVRDRLQAQLDNQHKFGPAEAKPYTFLLLESIRDSLSTQQERQAAFDADLAAAGQLLEQARVNLEHCQSEERAANDRLTGNRQPEKQTALARAVHLADLNSTIAAETVNLRQAEIEDKKAQCELGNLYRQLLEEKEKLVAPETRFGDRDRQSLLDNLAHKQQDFERQLKETEARLARNESQQTIDLARLDKEHADPAVVTAATFAYRRGRAVACEEIALLHARINELEERKYFVNCRYGLDQKTATPANLTEWHDRLTDVLRQLHATEQSLLRRIDEVRIDQASLYERTVDDDNQSAALRPWLDLQSQHLAQLAETCGASLLQVRSTERSLGRLQTQLESVLHQEARANPWETLNSWVAWCWTYELTTVGEQPITVGRISGGILYLIIGILLARLTARELARHVFPRLGLNPGASVAMQSIAFYVFCVLFSFVALELANLPFATFTFLGGAAAIGIGFGSQNVCNNFISGLILLAEQPIRVGDLVEIEGVRGTIESIGARSTRMKTLANHEIMVPNSQLLQDKVTNLTLSDDLVRASIEVKVTTGLSVDEVTRRLNAAASNHPKVLTRPEPVVLFQGFSSTDATFELHFWIKIASLIESRIVESEVRVAVCDALRDTGPATASAPPAWRKAG
ncbi:MAG TPA: mechanosensitive ion channel domain-containing protein [Pirellulales bacterium]|jgi:small-conductance mechanosensitive channel|nr:mechanosensitive ion channel domain-containing protein [Pirellulales bacterium]